MRPECFPEGHSSPLQRGGGADSRAPYGAIWGAKHLRTGADGGLESEGRRQGEVELAGSGIDAVDLNFEGIAEAKGAFAALEPA